MGLNLAVRNGHLPDLEVLHQEAKFDNQRLKYLVYETVTHEPQAHWRGTRWREERRYKAVILRELLALPRPPDDETAELDILGTTRTTLRGLYDARVDLAYLGAGFFSGIKEYPRYGLVQVYGVVAGGDTREAAIQAAEQAEGALLGTLANFIGIHTARLQADRARFILDAIANFPYVIALLGQADAKETPVMPQAQTGTIESEKPAEQNELLYRGMARINEDLIFTVLARRVSRKYAARLLDGALQEATQHASAAEGTRQITFSFGVPVMLQRAATLSESQAHTQGQAESVADGVTQSQGHTHTVGTAKSDSYAHTEGVSETWGEAHSVSVAKSESHSVSLGESHSTTEGQAHTTGSASTSGSFSSTGISSGVSGGYSHSVNAGVADGMQSQVTESTGGSVAINTSQGTAHTTGSAEAASIDAHESGGGSLGIPGLGANYNLTHGGSVTNTDSTNDTVSDSNGTTVGSQHSTAIGSGSSHVESAGASDSWSSGWSSGVTSAAGTSSSQTSSQSDSSSHAETNGTSRTETHASGTTSSVSDTVSHAIGRSSADTYGHSETHSEADAYATGESRSHTTGQALSAADARALAQSLGQGLTTGLSGGASIGKATRWVNEAEVYLANFWRNIARLADTLAAEGGFEVESFILTRTARGAQAAEALAVQAFHGLEDVVIPVTTVPLDETARAHVTGHIATFTPCRENSLEGMAGVLAGGQYGTANTLMQLAPLLAPALFEDGLASTNNKRPPDFGLYPELPGDVLLGYQYSDENYTGAPDEEPTPVPALLDQPWFYSVAVVGDSGTGKTTFAERLVLETTTKWHIRSVVLDFGKGWERLSNASGLQGHADSYSISPYGLHPLRFNPLQVPQRIQPGEYVPAVADLMGGTTGMGTVQIGVIADILYEMYLDLGALVNEPQVLQNSRHNTVTVREAEAIHQARQAAGQAPRQVQGLHLSALRPGEQQAVAIYRSRGADFAVFLERLEARIKAAKGGDEKKTLENIRLRLRGFGQADLYSRYKPLAEGEASTEVDALSLPWGLTVVSGGWGVPETLKSFLIARIAWTLYHDAAAQLDEVGVLPHRGLHIFIDEIQKLFGQAEGAQGNNIEPTTSKELKKMWPDGRKYAVAASYGTQNPSLLGIEMLSNCQIIATFRLKHPEDRDLLAEINGWSSKGFRHVNALQYIGTMAEHRCFLRYANHPLKDLGRRPMLIKPLRVPARTLSREEEAARYGVQLW